MTALMNGSSRSSLARRRFQTADTSLLLAAVNAVAPSAIRFAPMGRDQIARKNCK
jgi:hypothetical protein